MKKTAGAEFAKHMRGTHTIYMPDMLHYHNELLQAAFACGGYRLAVIPEYKNADSLALRYVSCDYCLPTIRIVSQIIAFLNDPETDAAHIAFLEPQAGGACRAGNIYHLIREVLDKTGHGDIPVISLNMTGEEKHPGFAINRGLVSGCVAAACYGDLLMMLVQQTVPYEKKRGSAEAKRREWITYLTGEIKKGRALSGARRRELYRRILDSFSQIPTERREVKKVGVVGEIYMKFSPVGNCHLEDGLRELGCACRLGGFVNYAIYVVYTELKNARLQRKNRGLLQAYEFVLGYLCRVQRELTGALAEAGREHDADFMELRALANRVISDDYNIGDGWLIAGEIMDLIRQGCDRILILHPFGCMVSHVGARGIIKKLKLLYPQVRLQSVEYDYDQSEALRQSRILLGIS